ncbi:MAG: hypothetical protein HYU27_07235 [Acidobacteria bacterium]|nr:hypothetical protein [Acidobacteriota bacterium]
MSKFTTHALAVCSIAAVSAVVYLPAVDNSFISDDFGIFPILKALEQNPSYIFDATSELFRVMSYIYFWICFTLFGLTPELYYWAGIGLHALVSTLVYFLVLRVSGRLLAAWPAGLFFAAYERHQEAVMWISAANEIILAVWCLVFLLLWERAVSRDDRSRIHAAAAFVVLALALFSKEAAVVLAPMATLGLVLQGYRARDILEKSIPVYAMLAAFVVLWLSQADRNFFLTDGHYALGLHVFPVYGRALLRLVSPLVPFVAALLVLRHRKTEQPWNSSFLFFGALLALAIVPYSFLTYQDHLPSRHTYLPSIGLAGLVGILFAAVHDRLSSNPAKQACAAFLLALVIGNGAYIWLKKEPQYRERAAPTRELIKILNEIDARDARRLPVYVCGFPLQSAWWFGYTVSTFTSLAPNDVVLSNDCVYPEDSVVLIWDPNAAQYAAHSGEDPGEPGAATAAKRN